MLPAGLCGRQGSSVPEGSQRCGQGRRGTPVRVMEGVHFWGNRTVYILVRVWGAYLCSCQNSLYHGSISADM